MKSSELRLVAITAFLSGFSRSQYVEDAIVRGSFVTRKHMALYRRECKDLDLLYLRKYSLDKIKEMVSQSLNNIRPADDVVFNLDSLSFEEIWKLSLSPGVRAEVTFIYGGNTESLQIDIAANDPLVEAPIPFIVDLNNGGAVELKTVTLETAVAWKFHGLFEHLNGAWMSKTLWDLYVLCRFNAIDKNKLRLAIQMAFSSRLDPLFIVKRFFYGDFAQSKKSRKSWDKDLVSLGVTGEPSLVEVLDWLKVFLSDAVDVKNDASLLTHSEVITYRVKELRKLESNDALAKLKTLNRKTKILPTKAYNSIPHLPGSRLGESERTIDANKVRMLTMQSMKGSDVVIIQEKLDGSCVCAYRRGNEILALGRDGDLASESPNYSRQLWSNWVDDHKDRFIDVLEDGERICGEWLALVHGTHYKLTHEPFVAFDLFDVHNRPYSIKTLEKRCLQSAFSLPFLVHEGEPCSIDSALEKLGSGFHGAIDSPEGLVFRIERNERLLFRAKYVRKDKVDGCYLPEKTGLAEIWNWHPKMNGSS